MSRWLTLKPEQQRLDTVRTGWHKRNRVSFFGKHMCLNYARVSLHTVLAPPEQQRSFLFHYVKDEDEDAAAGSALRQILQGLRAHLTLCSAKAMIPEMANPLKPTARTRKEMATARVWENPTTRSRVASIPKPAVKKREIIFLKVVEFY